MTIQPPQFQAYPAHAAQLIDAALAAANPATAVKRHLQRDGRLLTIGSEQIDLAQGRVFLISVGKAAVPMARAAADILGDLIASAILVTKRTTRDWSLEIADSFYRLPPPALRLFLSGHPLPDEESVRAGTAVLDLLAQTTENDLVLFLISGGASALLAQPIVPLADWQQLTQALLASGCTIDEFNCVRRQLDRVKGGGLASAAAPAACASLIISDVIGNSLTAIGSGPTVFVNESAAESLAVLARYQIAERLETAVWQRLTAALTAAQPAAAPPPAYNQHLIIGDLRPAAAAALTKAAQLGFIAQILTTQLEGEAREIGKVAAALAKDAPAGRCLILGGETTVTLHGSGSGGRNQELALAAAIALAGWPNRVIIAFASDGEDGPTDAAGAMVTGETAVIAQRRQLDPIARLNNNDSYTFFQQLDKPEKELGVNAEVETETSPSHSHHIQTGPTGVNVNDLLFILTYPEEIRNDE